MPFGGMLTMGALSAGTSLFSGITGGKAAKKAASQLFAAGNEAAADVKNQAQTGTAEVNTALGGIAPAADAAAAKVQAGTLDANSLLAAVLGAQTNIYSDQGAGLAPYLKVGDTSANQLLAAIAPGGDLTKSFSFDPTQISNNPDYQFQRDQGLQAIQRSASARGDATGGNTLKAAMQYASGLASTSLNDQYNRALTTYQTNRNNLLQTVMAGINTGQVANAQRSQNTNALSNVYSNFGNQAAQNTLQSAVYGGNIGYGAANTGLDTAKYLANLQQQAAEAAAQYKLQGAGAQASGTVASSNAFNNSLSTAVNSFSSPFMLNYVMKNSNPFGGNAGGVYTPTSPIPGSVPSDPFGGG